jgi:hypothetical protein
MKTMVKIKIQYIFVLFISILMLSNCSNKTAESMALKVLPLASLDTFESIMFDRTRKYAEELRSRNELKYAGELYNHDLDFTQAYPIKQKFTGELCECLVETEHILQVNLKADSNECTGSPIGYQLFRLIRFDLGTTDGKSFSFYTFASLKKDKDRNNRELPERLQNFYISEQITDNKLPSVFVFKKKYNYDYAKWVPLIKHEQRTNVDYLFEMDKSLLKQDTICLNKIISKHLNMIGGNKHLVFDIPKSFNTKGIIFKPQKVSPW